MKSFALVLFLAALAHCDEIPIGKSLSVPAATIQKWKDDYNRQDTLALTFDVNEYVDKLFEEIDAYLIQSGMDPADLQDIHEEFDYQPLVIIYHGELDLTKGHLQDLSTLHRTGDAELESEDGVLSFSVPVGFNGLVFDYEYTAQFMSLQHSGGVDGKVKNIKIDLEIDIDMKTNLLSLKSFQITDAGSISFSFTGNPLLDWIANLFTTVLTTVLHGVIVLIAQNLIRGNLEDVIDQINDAIANGQS